MSTAAIISDNPTRKELLALPKLPWDQTSIHDMLFVLPSGRKHESDYGLMTVVGANKSERKGWLEAQIAAVCDDLSWQFPTNHPYSKYRPEVTGNILRMDMVWPSKLIRYWASSEHYFRGRFQVGNYLSSPQVTLVVEYKESKGLPF